MYWEWSKLKKWSYILLIKITSSSAVNETYNCFVAKLSLESISYVKSIYRWITPDHKKIHETFHAIFLGWNGLYILRLFEIYVITWFHQNIVIDSNVWSYWCFHYCTCMCFIFHSVFNILLLERSLILFYRMVFFHWLLSFDFNFIQECHFDSYSCHARTAWLTKNIKRRPHQLIVNERQTNRFIFLFQKRWSSARASRSRVNNCN